MVRPRWRVIVEQIERDIAAGTLPPGAKLPSLAQWQDDDDSQTTVLRAYRDLVARGLIVTVQGKGSFVADPSDPGEMSLEARVTALERWRAEHEQGHP